MRKYARLPRIKAHRKRRREAVKACVMKCNQLIFGGGDWPARWRIERRLAMNSRAGARWRGVRYRRRP